METQIIKHRTENIKMLLRISESIDNNDTHFKRKIYNIILLRIKFIDESKLMHIEDHQIADNIISFVGKCFNVDESYSTLKSRKRIFVLPKQVSMTLIMENTELGWSEIGAKFGQNHAMPQYSHKTIDNLIDTNKAFKDKFENITERLGLKYKPYEKSCL